MKLKNVKNGITRHKTYKKYLIKQFKLSVNKYLLTSEYK